MHRPIPAVAASLCTASLIMVGSAASAAISTTLPGEVTRLIDFDTDALGNPILPGQIIDDEYTAWDVRVIGFHPTDRGLDTGITLDTTNTPDLDLRTGTSNGAYGPGNTTPLGNVLVLPQNLTDANQDGLVDDPTVDPSLIPNAVFTFEFDGIPQFRGGSVTIVDSDTTADLQWGLAFGIGIVQTYRDHQLLGTNVIPNFGDNSVVVVDLPTSSIAYDQVRVVLAGPSGVDNLMVTTVPEPGTAALMGLGTLAMLPRRKKA